jgi:DNA-binding response OmpR family regulator
MPRVLVIEDERKILRSLEAGLQAEGYEVATAPTGEEGYQLATAQPFDCLVLHLLLPGEGGLQVLADLRRAGHTTPVLILTVRDSVEQAKKLFEAAGANLESAGAKVKEALASWLRVAAERQRAELQYDRLKRSGAVVARDAIEETRLGAEAARAAVAEVEARVKSAEAARLESAAKQATAKADVAVAEARLRVAALLGYAKLKAPFAGVVTWRNLDAGHLLQPSAQSARGEAVFVVARTNPVRIFVDVPEIVPALFRKHRSQFPSGVLPPGGRQTQVKGLRRPERGDVFPGHAGLFRRNTKMPFTQM